MSQTVSQLIGEIEARGVDDFVAGVRRVGAETDKAGKQVDKSTAAMGQKMQAVGGKMQAVGGTLTKTVTLPLLALGGVAIAASNKVDDGMQTIRVGTGATGDALKGLEQVFKQVGKSTPSSLDDAATAVADLNTRLGLSGAPLQRMSMQMLNLARITKADLGETISATTRVFGDWGVATGRQAGALDKLFVASQATGITVGSLSQQLVKFGAPLRQMGFGLDESAALLAKFEKEGVNAELVMGSLRIALGKMANEGIEDPAEALRVMTKRIKEAGSTGKANALALEMFGARAGPDMAAAIREGRFEVADLIEQVASSRETINRAAKDGETFGEKLRKLGNRAMLAAAPFGDALKPVLDDVIGVVERLAERIESMSPRMRRIAVAVAVVVGAIGPLVLAGGTLVVMLGAMSAAAAALGVSLGVLIAVPLAVAVAIAGLVAGIVLLWKHSDAFRAGSKKIWGDIQKTFETTFAGLQATIQTWIGWARAAWAQWGAQISSTARSVWSGISTAIRGYLGMIRGVIQTVLAVLRGDWSGAWNGMKSIVSGALGVIRGIIGAQGAALRAAWGAIWSGLRSALVAAWGGIKSAAANHARGAAVAVLNGMTGGLAGLGARLLSLGKSAMQMFASGIRSIHIPTPHVDVSWGKASKGGVSIPVPKMDIDWYAKGGVFGGPKVIGVGEYPGARSNPEVVAPLSKLRDMITPMGGGGGRSIQITITGNTISKDMDIRRIGRELVRELRLQGVT